MQSFATTLSGMTSVIAADLCWAKQHGERNPVAGRLQPHSRQQA